MLLKVKDWHTGKSVLMCKQEVGAGQFPPHKVRTTVYFFLLMSPRTFWASKSRLWGTFLV